VLLYRMWLPMRHILFQFDATALRLNSDPAQMLVTGAAAD
jgi:hypothetical protein